MNFRSEKILFSGDWNNGVLVDHKVLHLAQDLKETDAIGWMLERLEKRIENRRRLPTYVMCEDTTSHVATSVTQETQHQQHAAQQ